MDAFDIFVIGSGPGGIACAQQASQYGFKVGIAENETFGGTCVNMGADPSKCLLRNSEQAFFIRNNREDFGISVDNLNIDYCAAVRRSRKIANTLSNQVLEELAANKIPTYEGHAVLLSPELLKITQDNIETLVKTKNVVIATGVSPLAVPGLEINGKTVITYREALLDETLPSSVLILGGGALGVEFATIWNGYGVDVTIVETMPQLVPYEDGDISEALTSILRKRGIKILTESQVDHIETTADTCRVTVTTPDGKTILRVSRILESYSFKHNSSGMGLEEIGVKLGQNGVILTDDTFSTNIPGIWAVGDVNGKLMVAASAVQMGKSVANHIRGLPESPLDIDLVPKVTYCHPQIASFGLNEKRAVDQGYDISIRSQYFKTNAMALANGDGSGFVKIIVNNKDETILGAHMIGYGVAELLPALVLASQLGLPASKIASLTHAHPSLGEAINLAARLIE